MKTEQGSFHYHYVPTLGVYQFTCWNPAHTGCGVHSVYPDEFEANLKALECHRVNRTASKEYWDYRARTWLPL